MHCAVAQTLEQIGEWWTLLILRDAFLGVRRFEDFQRRLGIARNILANRLDTLVEHGILERRRYSERPERFEYRLTDKGRDLWSVMTAIRQWGDKWVLPPVEPPVVLVHDTCGQRCHAEMHCSECGERLELHDLHLEPGPGAADPGFIAGRADRSSPAC
jgi:DNA-binding HxlR family transcriptional regulator